ncbi:MAG: helicase, partial [Propionibacteriaceae bacterium]|nr:helicase [Propionibacteriaceae bacterium]
MLARWGGWGALWQVFDEDKSVWSKERSRLKELLSEEEYQAARLTTINAHYTDPALVAPIWGLLKRLGLSQGRVLEPGCGAGTFIGMAPAGVSLTGIELDPLTASIAAALYPLATIRAESFSDTRFTAGWFDGAVGNVPFADVVLHDPRYNQARLAMHNYFIVKSLELVRPGGVVAFLTSSFTMDAVNPAARRAMAARADLIAAVRLPTGAHRRAAGTDVVTDLVVLRRRGVDEPPRDAEWDKAVRCELPGPHGPEEVDLNEYWAAHPDHVLGRLEVAVGMHGVAGLVALTGDLGQTGARLERILDAVAEEALASG